MGMAIFSYNTINPYQVNHFRIRSTIHGTNKYRPLRLYFNSFSLSFSLSLFLSPHLPLSFSLKAVRGDWMVSERKREETNDHFSYPWEKSDAYVIRITRYFQTSFLHSFFKHFFSLWIEVNLSRG